MINPERKLLSPALRKQLLGFENTCREGARDFSGEKKFQVTDFLIHRYPDRAVLLATGKCFARCSFCFRRDWWDGREIDRRGMQAAKEYLRAHPAARELIISGGDPLTLTDGKLRELLACFSSLPFLNLFRVASRALSFKPERVGPGLAKVFRQSRKPVWFISHFNHGDEINQAVAAAVKRLRLAGVPVLNQTVLLKGVNDRVSVLSELFRSLAGLGVKPYYLFQCDPCPGGERFATDLEKSIALVRQLSGLSGIVVPRFAFELPGYGKLSPEPEWQIRKRARHYQLTSPAGKTYFYPR